MAQNNGDIFDATGLKQIFQMLLDQSNGQPETLARNAVTDDIRNLVRGSVKDINNITIKEIDKIIKALTSEMRSMFGGNAALTGYFKLMAELLKQMAESNKGSLNETQIVNRIIAALSNAFQASYDAKRSGQGTVYVNYDSSKAKGDPGAQKLISTFIPQHLVKTNLLIEKVLNFLNGHKAGERTRQRHFVDDLVEGLARSKFVGGALSDFIKLGALFLATWLKDKGTWGKVLAVGLVAASPIIGAAIAGALVKGITSLFTKTVGLIAMAILTPVRWLGGKIGTWVTQIISAIWARSAASSVSQSVAQTGASDVILYDQYGKPMKSTPKTPVPPKGAGGRIGPFGYALAATAANVGFGMVSDNTNIDPRLVHSVSGITQGALLGAATKNPYVIAAGAIIGGLYGLIKGHYEKQEELGEEQLDELKKKKGGFWDWLKGDRDEDASSYGSSRLNSGSSDSYFTPSNTASGSSLVVDLSNNTSTGGKFGLGTFNNKGVTSKYGMRLHPTKHIQLMHEGIDLDYKNEPVGAFVGGDIVFAGTQRDEKGRETGYGNYVVVRDELGAKHTYGHLSSIDEDILTGKRTRVGVGESLGISGKSGSADGLHLHYDVYKDGRHINPQSEEYKELYGHISSLPAAGSSSGLAAAAGLALSMNPFTQPLAKALGVGVDPLQVAITSAQEATARKTSIGVDESKKDSDIVDVTESASVQAKTQWDRINEEFRNEAKSTNILSPDTQNLIDFAGTETCSKVLQSVVNAQQQAYVQQR